MPASSRPWIPGGRSAKLRCGQAHAAPFALCVALAEGCVLNAYFSLGHSPGGFRVWWRRWHDDRDEQRDFASARKYAPSGRSRGGILAFVLSRDVGWGSRVRAIADDLEFRLAG